MVEVQAHKGIAGFKHGEEHGGIGLRTAMRLHVGVFCTKELLDALDGNGFRLVHHAATAVIAFARVALSVFIGEARAHSLHHFAAHEVFRRDEFDAAQLAAVFAFDELENLRIVVHSMENL